MQAKVPADTPSVVRVSLWMNVVLLLIALIMPRTLAEPGSGMAEAAGAAMLFVIPMALIFAIGSFAAIRAYILARREGRAVRWTAFVPLAMFLVGIVATLVLIYTENVI